MEARYGGLEGVQACRLIKGYSLCTEELLPSILKLSKRTQEVCICMQKFSIFEVLSACAVGSMGFWHVGIYGRRPQPLRSVGRLDGVEAQASIALLKHKVARARLPLREFRKEFILSRRGSLARSPQKFPHRPSLQNRTHRPKPARAWSSSLTTPHPQPRESAISPR
jgi:hypothetical protein